MYSDVILSAEGRMTMLKYTSNRDSDLSITVEIADGIVTAFSGSSVIASGDYDCIDTAHMIVREIVRRGVVNYKLHHSFKHPSEYNSNDSQCIKFISNMNIELSRLIKTK